MARFSKFPADVVVTDLNMPNMGGLTLLTTLRALDPDVPVILTTASSALECRALRAETEKFRRQTP